MYRLQSRFEGGAENNIGVSMRNVTRRSLITASIKRINATQRRRRPRFSFFHPNCQRTDDRNRPG